MNRILLCATMLALPEQAAVQHIGVQVGVSRLISKRPSEALVGTQS